MCTSNSVLEEFINYYLVKYIDVYNILNVLTDFKYSDIYKCILDNNSFAHVLYMRQ